MSTKTKSSSSRTSTQKIQPKPGRTSDRKPERVRNVNQEKDDKTPKTEANKSKATYNEDRQKTKTTKAVKKPVVAKPPSLLNTPNAIPPNRRVVKTQFFPTKNNYAEMLKHLNQNVGASGDNIKKARKNTEKSPERPRTSTLRKGNIVNENIAGPEIPKKSPSEEEPDYEDDFDSYESDFENVSSSESTVHNLSEISTESTSSSSSDEEASSKGPPSVSKDLERKLDSGNFDLKDDKMKKEFSNLQDLIEKENSNLKRPESNMKSSLTSLSDEGFEEAKSLQYLNFVSAKKRNERRKSMEIRKKRGSELLNMIKLDCVNFTILDTPSIPYEQFIKTFGSSNTMQIGSQTGEENVNEEIQTDLIELSDKWTQMPPNFTKDSKWLKWERIGVGPPLIQELEEEKPQFNNLKLEKFLLNTGNLVLDILKERKLQQNGNGSKDVFSETVVNLKPPSEFSGKKKVSLVVPNRKSAHMFLSVHVNEDFEEYPKSMVYVWNINETLPEMYLNCHGKITSCCFGNNSRIVFAGLQNGSLAFWNTSINETTTNNVCKMIEGDFNMQNPTFITEIEKSHYSPVVSIQCVTESHDQHLFNQTESASKIYSLDQEGTIFMWNILSEQRNRRRKTFLMKNFEVDLRNLVPEVHDLLCNDMFVSDFDSRLVFIATNYGSVLQCELNNEKTQLKQHNSELATSPVKCLVQCPFSDTFFLAGLENGSILLYSKKVVKPLMVITNKESVLDGSIEELQWSLEKPCVFYTKNSSDTIDCWDLSKSNVYPVESLKFEEEVTCLRLSRSEMDKSYLISSTKSSIRLHFFQF